MLNIKNVYIYFVAIKIYLSKFLKDIYFQSNFYQNKLIEKKEIKIHFIPNSYLLSSFTNNKKFEFDIKQDFTNYLLTKSSEKKRFKQIHNFLWLSLIDRKNDGVVVRKMIDEWIKKFGEFKNNVWEPSLTSLRVISWILNADLVLNNKNIVFKNEYFKIIFAQINHLKRNYVHEENKMLLIEVLTAIMISGIVFKNHFHNYEFASDKMDKLLDNFLDRDGFPLSKNPKHIVKILKYLILIKECLKDAQYIIPDYLEEKIKICLRNLASIITPNKQIPLMNGPNEISLDIFLDYLKTFNYKLKEDKNTAHNVKKLKFKKDTIYFDTNNPPSRSFSNYYQSGPLSFEYFHEKNKVITNSGFGSNISDKATLLSRLTSSQSTLTINNISTVRLEKSKIINKAFGYLIKSNFSINNFKIIDENNFAGFEATHDAYKKKYNIIIHRKIMINKSTEDINGSDVILSTKVNSNIFDIRFHLYPGINAVKTMSGKGVLIQVNKNKSLLFDADGCKIDIEKGLFFGRNKIFNNYNIFLKGKLTKEKEIINWKIRKKIDVEAN